MLIMWNKIISKDREKQSNTLRHLNYVTPLPFLCFLEVFCLKKGNFWQGKKIGGSRRKKGFEREKEKGGRDGLNSCW